jgi:hypothetical protein
MSKTIFSANKTSARLLVDYALQKWAIDSGQKNTQSERLYLISYDLYIKARSYAIINKLAFWMAVVAGILVLAWPSLAIIAKDFGYEKEFLKSAIVQTTVTGLAALTFAVYSHYKKRQVYLENLMRRLIYADQSNQLLLDKILSELERLDTGFGFSDALTAKAKDSIDKN